MVVAITNLTGVDQSTSDWSFLSELAFCPGLNSLDVLTVDTILNLKSKIGEEDGFTAFWIQIFASSDSEAQTRRQS